MNSPIQVAILGFGFMGKRHADIYRQLENAKVTAVVDPRRDEIRESLAEVNLSCPVYSTLHEAVASSEFSAVDICLPTDLHRDQVLSALSHGKHVFCEKPISLTTEEALEMTEAARRANLQFMVGHCIRFWPEYIELQRLVSSGAHGRLMSLSLTRRTGRPGYSVGNWVNQPERCLGAALDLHIHDADFLLHLLGKPEAVFSRGLNDSTGWSSLTTQYVYEGMNVMAEGAWNYPSNWGFQMRFTAVFEDAVLDYDSAGSQTLLLTVGQGTPQPLILVNSTNNSTGDGYHRELAYFVNCLERNEPVTVSTGEQAMASLNLVLAEIESAKAGHPVFL